MNLKHGLPSKLLLSPSNITTLTSKKYTYLLIGVYWNAWYAPDVFSALRKEWLTTLLSWNLQTGEETQMLSRSMSEVCGVSCG